MIVVAIVAILASVAIPAYINYVNRAIQSDAITALMAAKMDQEVFFEQYFRYAGTAGCLSSLSATADCTQREFTTGKGYQVSVVSADAETFTMAATKRYYSYAPIDRVEISSSDTQPRIVNPSAIGFSIFKWVFY